MKSIKILTGLALLCLAGEVSAQNEVDALRYSRLGFGGTARSQAIGGAQTALGADAANLSGNPAGLGLYRRSEFSFTPGITFGNTTSSVTGQSSVDQRNNINLAGFGLVFANRKSDGTEGSWRGGAFGIGFTRQNHFQNKFNYRRQTGTTEATILEAIAESATRNGLSSGNNAQSLDDLAYDAALINYDQTQGDYYAIVREGQINQSEDVLARGAQNQWDFSYGGSFQDVLYLGGSIGFSTLRYNQQRTYREAESDATTDFENLSIYDEFTTTGNGINARLGVIVKPVDMLRFGVSYQSPTYFSMRDEYFSELQTQNGTSFDGETDPGEYEYRLKTPARITGGVAVIAGKYGFFSGDVEYVDYTQARLRDDADNEVFRDSNNDISSMYRPSLNVRLGAEGRFDIFRVRAGFAMYGDPYDNSSYDRKKTYITAGAGIKQANYFFDLALVNSAYNSVYSPYVLNNQAQPVVTTKNRYNNFMFTLGMNF
ncbi:MAG: OmpP1/FadL family transporter [Adhaeribacter sp.]